MESQLADDTSDRIVRGLGCGPRLRSLLADTIGTGIFLVTSDMARAVGSATLVLAAWIVGGVIVLFGAFLLCRTGRGIPQSRRP